jgi:hypothetical protein
VGVQIRQGWSGQVATNPDRWAKFDVSLDETDLTRLLLAAQIPVERLSAVPPRLVFQLLEIEAEILVYAKLVTRYGCPPQNAKTADQEGAKAMILDQIRTALT